MSNINYEVNVDSRFRDVSQYPNPTDFAVSFTQPADSDNSILGKPSAGYLSEVSIDPDYVESDFTFKNGRVNSFFTFNGDIFVSGVMESQVFIVEYKSDIIISISPEGYESMPTSPFLLKLNSNYELQWIIYSINPLESISSNLTTSCKLRVSQQGGVYIIFDTNSPVIDMVIRTAADPSTKTNIQSIDNQANPFTSVVLFAVDRSGQPYIVNNQNFSYHILSSNFAMTSESPYGNFDFYVDNAESLFVCANTDPFALSYLNTTYYETSAPNIPTYNPDGFYAYESGDTIYSILTYNSQTSNPDASTPSTLYFFQSPLTGTVSTPIFRGKYILPIPAGSHVTGQRFASINNNLYMACVPSQPGAVADIYQLTVFKIDQANSTGTLVAATGYFNYINIGDFTAAGKWNLFIHNNSNTQFAYEFNPTGNALIQRSAMTTTGTSNTAQSVCYSLSGSNYMVSMDLNYSFALNDNMSKNFRYQIYQYTGATFISKGKVLTYGTPTAQVIFSNSVATYLISGFTAPALIQIIDVSNPNSPTIVNEIQSNFFPIVKPFSYVTNGVTHYYMVVSGNGGTSIQIYNIDDVTSPYLIGPGYKDLIPNPAGMYIDSKGYMHTSGNNGLSGFYSRILTFLQPTVIKSTHSYSNTKNIVSSTGTAFKTLSISNASYTYIASASNISVYNCSNPLLVTPLQTNPYTFPSSPIEIDVWKSVAYTGSFAAVTTLTNIDLFYLPDNITSNHIQTFAVTGTSRPVMEMLKSIFYSTTGSEDLMLVCQKNCRAYKYSISPTGATLIVSRSIGNYSYASYLNMAHVQYYPYIPMTSSSNKTMLLTVSNATDGYATANSIYSGYDLSNRATIDLVAYYGAINLPPNGYSFVFVDNYATYGVLRPKQLPYQVETDIIYNFADPTGSVFTDYYANNTLFSSTDVLNHQAITAWVDPPTKKVYCAMNYNSNGGPNDYIQICDITVPKQTIDFKVTNTIQVSGNIIDMTHYTSQNNRIILVALLSTGDLFYYDVSNVTFAGQNYVPRLIGNQYASMGIGTSFVIKIDNEGKDVWMSKMGSDSVDRIGQLVTTNSLVNIGSNIYVGGSFVYKLQLFNPNNTVSNQIRFYSTSNENGFVAKLRIDSGEWNWIQPLSGDKQDIVTRIRTDGNKLYSLLKSSSDLCVLYSPQQAGDLANPISFLTTFTNTSLFTTFVSAITLDGALVWKNSIFTVEGQKTIDGVTLEISSNYVFAAVVVDANTIQSDSTDQAVYLNLNSQQALLVYQFSHDGVYLASNYSVYPQGGVGLNAYKIFVDESNNLVRYFPYCYLDLVSSPIRNYNKDGTLGGVVDAIIADSSLYFQNTYTQKYLIVSNYTDQNQKSYSRIVYNTGVLSSGAYDYAKQSVYLLGDPSDMVLNSNFSVRSSTQQELILNSKIATSQIVRKPPSDGHYLANLSTTLLAAVLRVQTLANPFTAISSSPLDTTSTYFVVSYTGGVCVQTRVTGVVVLGENRYQITTESGIIPANGYVTINKQNSSAANTLQFYPGSFNLVTYYNVSLNELVIPNRAIVNSSLPGVQFLDQYPYIYLMIYNEDDAGFAVQQNILSLVYDNNTTRSRAAIYKINANMLAGGSNWATLSSSNNPRIVFRPGYTKLHFRLVDPDGNVILFDNTPTPNESSLFTVVPDRLMQMCLRLSFARVVNQTDGLPVFNTSESTDPPVRM